MFTVTPDRPQRVDLSSYTIRLANVAQEIEHWRASYVHWGRGKDWAVEKCKSEGDWGREGGFRCWVLVRRDAVEGPIYSGCETFRRKAFQRENGSNEVRDTFSYAVASVVTPEPLQRQGYASHLLSLLHYLLGDPVSLPPFPTHRWGPPPPLLSAADHAQFPPGIASVLFSDVGSTFYERATIGLDWTGYIVEEESCHQVTWELKHRPGPTEHQWDWIYLRDLSAVSGELSRGARKRMESAHPDSTTSVWAPDPASDGTLAFVPTTAVWWRSNPTSVLEAEICGVRLPAIKADQEEAIVLFTAGQALIGDAMLVTYVHNLDADQLPLLNEALDEVGSRMGLKEGWIWGLEQASELGKAWMSLSGRKVKAGRRDETMGHLLGVAWYGTPESRGELADSAMWTWC
ncbi:uncharacterized protein MKK02DRAFT_23838 [Dioszegia hungarica]|uniref:N-acetyltransferase domain-containing protein n=1 Tax=Dioszegia hungarica TaxID=4972 RepID=A0AA38HBC9_9TREE|nr:uncharacterized protein MKK02DRAFT_23838 [Dioszegia hungarica]KAI9637278.1 hypothetical protein MKK02DRAFT_23838 [Dioszegia hungarica]